MVVGVVPSGPREHGQPGYLIAGRQIARNHYEAVADVATGFKLGDPMVFIPLKNAQEAQFLKDNDAIVQQRRRTAGNPAFNRPGTPGLLDAVLVQFNPGFILEEVAEPIRRRKRLQVYTTVQMEEILIDKLIATAAKQIGTRNLTIAGMIMQQALGLGVIGSVVGKISATFWAPIFPKYVLLEPGDALLGFTGVPVICAWRASWPSAPRSRGWICRSPPARWSG